jgi:hypothetical protein
MGSKSLWAVAGLGTAIALGGAFYYLSQEERVVVFDPSVHTREKLLEILEEMEIEYGTVLIHWYHILSTYDKDPT